MGATQAVTGVAVSNGIFTVRLDFGANFPGADRFLEICVRTAGGGAYTPLTPRQPLTTVPYAVKSLTSDNANNLGGLAANTYLQINGNGSQLTNLNGGNITNNTVTSVALAADVFPNQQNLKLLGMRCWDLLGQRVTVGTRPNGIAFDGTNMWVANFGSNNVTKLRASDGALQGTFAVGANPFGVAFDGANMWVTNQSSNNVTKLPVSP